MFICSLYEAFMDIELFATFLKLSIINLYTSLIFLKILNYNHFNFFKKFLLTTIIIIISFLENILQKYVPILLLNTIIYTLYSFILGKFTKITLGHSLIAFIISSSISYISYSFSAFIVCLFISFFNNFYYKNLISFIFIFFINLLFIKRIFRIKKFKYGISFIKNNSNNNYLDILILTIAITIVFICFLFGNYKNMTLQYLTVWLIIYIIFMFIIIQKSFIIYQKQKLLEKTLKDYEQEIAESKNKFEILLKEKNNLVKANHEFYHRQQALNLKLDNLIKNNKTLFKEEYGSIIDRIDTLSREYTSTISNTKTQAILPKTNISEIDDMFIYMQNECKKNNIDFTLRLTSDIYQLINNIIPKNKFETLIGDLIRNSIIAINYSSNKNRAIMIILGIKDNTYEFSIYDTGIEFKIETLSKLGLERATTHADTGGTGIGFITTFETLKYCKASLIIAEFSDRNFEYSKSITIKFEYKNNYIIETYRADQFPEDKRVKIYPTNIKI